MPEHALRQVRHSWPGAFVAGVAGDATFDAAIRTFTRRARDRHMPIERALAMLKRELTSLTPVAGNVERADRLMDRAVQVAIGEYYK